MGNQILFFTFIPVAMFFLLSLRTVIEDEPSESLKVFTHLHWSLILTTFTISHIAYLTSLPSIPGEENPHQALIFFLIFLTQSNDIFQYIFGMTLGKKPISPKISPKKTIVGAVGGVAGSLVLSYLFASAMPLSVTQCLTVGFFVSIAGLLGDLNISAIKRSLDVKDMSNLIPGHGGILDRIDSLTFSSIIYFYIIFYWIYL
jgi:phosphatidate cytidylyltransferase